MPIPSVKEISELVKFGVTIEAQEKIMELREAALEIQEENLTLKGKNKELEEKLKRKEELFFKDQFYWKTDDATPFCPRCWEKHQEVIHVSPEFIASLTKKRTCPECSRDYVTGKIPYIPPPQRRRSQYD